MSLEDYRRGVVRDVVEIRRRTDGSTKKLRVHRVFRAEVEALLAGLKAARFSGS